MIGGENAKWRHQVRIDADFHYPLHLPDDIAEDWQLMEDLLMSMDRHEKNYLLRLDASNHIVEVALIDNGLSLPAHPHVAKKFFEGPREGAPISELNQARLRHLLDNETVLWRALKGRLESAALKGLFARAKALLARGTYGSFELDEINAHLKPEDRSEIEIYRFEKDIPPLPTTPPQS